MEENRAKAKCQNLEWQKQNGQKLVWQKQNFPLCDLVMRENQKNVKPAHCVMLCDLVMRETNKLWLLQILDIPLLRYDLSCTKFHDFQAR
jgi:hypothetical protein